MRTPPERPKGPGRQQAGELIEQGRQARRDDRPDDARRHFAEAVVLARTVSAGRELIDALKGLGLVERDRGRPKAALRLYAEALALCRVQDDPLLVAHTVRHVGDLHREAGRLERAEPCYVEALELYRAHDHTHALDLANAVRPMALLRQAQGAHEEAITLWSEARELYAREGVEAGVVESDYHLARLERN